MCAGTRDVANLYWKLALICQGKVTGENAERLLDSYETERKPNAREYIKTAVRLGGLINTAGTEEAMRAALPTSPGGSTRMESIAPPLGVGIGISDKTGRLFGQPRLRDGSLMDETHRHQLVVAAESKLAAGLSLPAGVGLVTTDNSNAAERLARFGARATVLRPDRHTLGSADTQVELKALLALVLSNPIETRQAEMVSL